jgi:hypothetical protein
MTEDERRQTIRGAEGRQAMSGLPGLREFYDKQKETCGGWATYLWIGAGLYLFLNDGGARSLVSFRALVFFPVGMYAAAVVLGSLGYGLQRLTAKVFVRVFPKPTHVAVAIVRGFGWVLFVLDTAVGFLAAWTVYNYVLWK